MHFNCKIKEDNYTFTILKDEVEFSSKDFFKNKLFAQSEFLRHSKNISKHIAHHIIEVKKEDKVLGHLYFQTMPFKGSELSSYIPQNDESCLLSKTMEAIVDLAIKQVNWSLLVLGNVYLTGDNGQYWQKELEAYTKWKIIREAANYIASQTKVDAFLVSDLREADIQGKEKMIEHKYRLLEVEPDLIFDLDPKWHVFEDYLTSILSKYRVRTKKVLKTSAALEINDLSASEIKENTAQIFKLYQNVVDSAAFKLAQITPNYFEDFKLAYPEKFFVRGYFLKEELIAFICYFVDDKTLHINFIGMDYGLNKKYSIYQRVLYDCIEQGILLKKEQIHFGRTASEIKTSVGAKPVKAYSFVKHNSRISNIAIKPLTNYMKPEPFEVRNPFGKKEAG